MKTRASCLTVGLAWFAFTGARALAQLSDSSPAAPESALPVTAEATKDITFKPSIRGSEDFTTPMTNEQLTIGKPAEPDRLTMNERAAVLAGLDSDKTEKSVGLSPYIVRELPHREMTEVTDAIDQQNRLRSRALYKKDLTQKVRMEVLAPPTEGFNGTANLPLLRFTW
jgi:hypothetical protein